MIAVDSLLVGDVIVGAAGSRSTVTEPPRLQRDWGTGRYLITVVTDRGSIRYLPRFAVSTERNRS